MKAQFVCSKCGRTEAVTTHLFSVSLVQQPWNFRGCFIYLPVDSFTRFCYYING